MSCLDPYKWVHLTQGVVIQELFCFCKVIKIYVILILLYEKRGSLLGNYETKVYTV